MELQLQNLQFRGSKDIQATFGAAKKGRADALIVVAGGSYREQIVNLAAKTRPPAMYTDPTAVPAGGLMSYGATFLSSFGEPPPMWTRF
jgi:hypothetical protein